MTDDLILPPKCEKDEAITFLEQLKKRGTIIGTDEAGRGALAGPVVAAAAYLTQEQENALMAMGLKDSKRVSPNGRERLFSAMKDLGVIWRAYMADTKRVDRDNVLNASLWAMGGAVSKAARYTGKAECVIVDGNERIPGLEFPQWVYDTVRVGSLNSRKSNQGQADGNIVSNIPRLRPRTEQGLSYASSYGSGKAFGT